MPNYKPSIYLKKTDAMQKILHLVSHGYNRYITNEISIKKAPALIIKFIELYKIDSTEMQRYRAKKKGQANVQLVLWKANENDLLWWLLVSDGRGLIDDLEKDNLISVKDKNNRLTITGYELIKMPFKNREPSWSYRMTKETYHDWEERIKSAVRHKKDKLVRQSHYSLSRTPGFAGARRQGFKLAKLLDAEIKACREYFKLAPTIT